MHRFWTMTSMPGKVYLVGAGPGDVGLITLRAVECLGQAQVVVYDHLANESLLSHAPADAERIYVGKSASRHTMKQNEINELLVNLALQGKTVVRLKGGDPFVFGRGGEEALCLAEHKIGFEIVPGISSALAVPAYAGIPVTQRNVNASLHIVTGHEDPDKDESVIEWELLGKTEGTLVFLMGVGNLPKITQELVRHGKSPETPVALIRWGTLAEQETLVSDLAHVVEEVKRRNFLPPAVTVIGSVVALRPLLQWAEKRPLFGVRVALTRPVDQSKSFADALRREGADVLLTPTIRIQPRKLTPAIRHELTHLAGYDWIVFTSTNGVRITFDLLFAAGLDGRALAGLRVAAIGERTADSLMDLGIRPDVVPEQFVQEGLAKAMDVKEGQMVLIARAAEARDALQKDLEARGALVSVLPVYDTVADKEGIAQLRRELTRGRVHLVTFTSSSTVEHLVSSVKSEDIPRLFTEVNVASIGPITTRTLEKIGLPPQISATHYSARGLAEAIVEYYKAQKA